MSVTTTVDLHFVGEGLCALPTPSVETWKGGRWVTDGWLISPSTANAVPLPHQREVLRSSNARPYGRGILFIDLMRDERSSPLRRVIYYGLMMGSLLLFLKGFETSAKGKNC